MALQIGTRVYIRPYDTLGTITHIIDAITVEVVDDDGNNNRFTIYQLDIINSSTNSSTINPSPTKLNVKIGITPGVHVMHHSIPIGINHGVHVIHPGMHPGVHVIHPGVHVGMHPGVHPGIQMMNPPAFVFTRR